MPDATTVGSGIFAHIPPFAGDPILSLNQAFQQDPRAGKTNLSIGIYFDETGRLPVLSSVRRAEAMVVERGGPRSYLPIEGAANYRDAVQSLLFGPQHEAIRSGRVATIQSIGSSGGLTVGASILRRHFASSDVWVSDPTWDNHRVMFDAAGLALRRYPYFDAANGGVAFEAMLETFRGLPARSVTLLHVCCHNPTGADLTRGQWDALIPVLLERELIPFLDLAYQGFADGIESDAYPVRALADAGVPFFIANSFSKSMSLYGERCGALSVVCSGRDDAERMLGQMKFSAHRSYSSPPIHGGQIAATVLTDAVLRREWESELDAMRCRMLSVRSRLHALLQERAPDVDFSYLLRQRGMFSYTGLSVSQVTQLREQHALYMLDSGRICVAGLNDANIESAAASIAAVL